MLSLAVRNGRLKIWCLKKKQITTTKRNIQLRPSLKTFFLAYLYGLGVRNAPSWHSVVTKPPEGVWFCWREKFCQVKGMQQCEEQRAKSEGRVSSSSLQRKGSYKMQEELDLPRATGHPGEDGKGWLFAKGVGNLRVTVLLAEHLSGRTSTPPSLYSPSSFIMLLKYSLSTFHLFFHSSPRQSTLLGSSHVAAWPCGNIANETSYASSLALFMLEENRQFSAWYSVWFIWGFFFF